MQGRHQAFINKKVTAIRFIAECSYSILTQGMSWISPSTVSRSWNNIKCIPAFLLYSGLPFIGSPSYYFKPKGVKGDILVLVSFIFEVNK